MIALRAADLRRLSQEVRDSVGPSSSLRILHVSDFHNRVAAFRFTALVSEQLQADLVINTGDLSGIGGVIEERLIKRFWRLRLPCVFAPGNHDSVRTTGVLRSLGVEVLDRPRSVLASGLEIWGYPDPNRTPLFGPRYSSANCRRAAKEVEPPQGSRPLIAAVHNRHMIDSPPERMSMVLYGHNHGFLFRRKGPLLQICAGSTGGGGPFGGPLSLAVIDADTSGVPQTVWEVKVHLRKTLVNRIDVEA